MALTIRVTQIEVFDPDGTGAVRCQVVSEVKNDDASAVAVGAATGSDSRLAVCSRAAFNAFIGALRRPNTDTWPDGTLPHPVTKLP